LPKAECHVVEFRDPSWLINDVFQLLQHYGVSFRIHDPPLLQIPRRVNALPVYIRLHGDCQHDGDYQLSTLKPLAKALHTVCCSIR